MTISKEKFEQMALEVFNDFCVTEVSPETRKDMAHALIKRVEAEVVERRYLNDDGSISVFTYLPLVEE